MFIRAHINIPAYRALIVAGLTMVIATLLMCPRVFAQSSNYSQGPQTSGPVPEPIGSGSAPQPVSGGDSGNPLQPGSNEGGIANFPPNFQTTNPATLPVVHLYMQSTKFVSGKKYAAGLKEVLTLRPDQLHKLKLGQQRQLMALLGEANFSSGNANVSLAIDRPTLEQIQAILAPYPQYSVVNGKKQLGVTGQRESLYIYKGTLPTVRLFSKYLVLLGVVIATILMALAAWAVVRGERDAGAKVVGVASGLIMLLMAFTIYKVVILNMMHKNTFQSKQITTPFVGPVNLPATPVNLSPPSVTAVPSGGREQPQRSGVPVAPLKNAEQQP